MWLCRVGGGLPTYCCDRKVRVACAQSFTLWLEATIENIHRNHSSRTPVILFNRSHVSIQGLQQHPLLFTTNRIDRMSFLWRPLSCNRKIWAACVQSCTLWQQATIQIMLRNHSSRMLVILFNRLDIGIGRHSTPQSLFYCLFVPHVYGCCSSRTSHSWWITHLTQRQRRGCNNVPDNIFIERNFVNTNLWHLLCCAYVHCQHIIVSPSTCLLMLFSDLEFN